MSSARPGQIDRRIVLRGAGGAALALPFPGAMAAPGMRAPAPASESKPPQRFVVFFTPGGTVYEDWRPRGGETDFTLSTILSALEPFRRHIVVLDGIQLKLAPGPKVGPHPDALASLLTGQALAPGAIKLDTGTPGVGFANGPSVDQVIAQKIGAGTKFRSLELAPGWPTNYAAGVYPTNVLNTSGPGQAIAPINDPVTAWRRIFGWFSSGDPAAQARARRQATSVLDAVAEEYAALDRRLGSEDRRKIASHLDRVREVEVSLQRLQPSVAAACRAPVAPPAVDHTDPINIPATGRQMMDMLAMALACDLTRVGTIEWTDAAADKPLPFLAGLTDTHHGYQHDTAYQPDAITRINRWFCGQLAYFLGRLAEVREADGSTLLDNTLVFWCNEISHPPSHGRKNMPFVLAGGAGGRVRGGRFLHFPGEPAHSNLLVTLTNAFGIESETFGHPEICTGPLPEILRGA